MIEKNLRLDQIKVPKSRIRTSIEKKEEMEKLADSIKKLGLFHPILVDEDYNLIAGFRRLTAFKQLALEDPNRFGIIPVRIMPKANRARSLEAEIHENWTRKQLKGYELDTALAELKKIYQDMHPETKRGAHLKETRELGGKKVPSLSEIGESSISDRVKTPRFAKSMSKTLDVAESTVSKRTRVGEAIIEGKFDEETIEEYKEGIKTHTEMLKIYQEQKKEEKRENECDTCEFYGECDHQGAYKTEDGRWCYERKKPEPELEIQILEVKKVEPIPKPKLEIGDIIEFKEEAIELKTEEVQEPEVPPKEEDKIQMLSSKFIDRLGDWKLEWEVLWAFFAILIRNHNLTEEQLDNCLEEALSEWDL